MRSVRVLAFLAVAAGVSAGPGLAQTIRGTITGTVTDSTGAVVPGVTVTVTHLATGIGSSGVTDHRGGYTIPLLAPGTYQASVEQSGFKKYVRGGVVVQIAQTTRVDIGLQVGEMSEEVQVTAEAPLVRSTTSELGQVVEMKQIQALPLNGRLFQQLVAITPGTVGRSGGDGSENAAAAGARSNTQYSVNGMPWSGNNFLLDGVANNEPLNSLVNIAPPLEAIQEFKVQTNNPTAEFGVFGGAAVNLTIRSGTNELHGSAFGYLRDESLNAQQLLRPHQGPLQVAPVRGHAGRSHPEEPGLLLRRLPGAAAGPGPDPDHLRPHRAHAPGQPQRDPRAHLRSAHRTALCRQHHPGGPPQPHRPAGGGHLAAPAPPPAWPTTTSRTT